jgi:uncharacterized protein YjiS (DUF1127 family)
MEIAMLHSESDDDRRLPPERWDLLKGEVLVRAREARGRMLRGFGGVLVRQAVAVGGHVWEAYRAWRQRRTAAFELAGLDDRSLRDLGINRSEITSVVAGWDGTRLPRGQIAVKRPREAVTSNVGRKSRTPDPLIQKTAA